MTSWFTKEEEESRTRAIIGDQPGSGRRQTRLSVFELHRSADPLGPFLFKLLFDSVESPVTTGIDCIYSSC